MSIEQTFNKTNYKPKINKMIENIENPEFLEMLYGFVKRLYKEEKAED